MKPEEASRRIAAAHDYFVFLLRTMSEPWDALFARYRSGALSLVEAVTLVHPNRIPEDRVTPGRCTRTFTAAIPNYEWCHSEELWGYECPFAPVLEIDHLFPWALGGPTYPENAVYLCRDHNRAKGHDLHLIPWDEQSFSWLPRAINEVARLL